MDTQVAGGQQHQQDDNAKLFQELDAYPWDTDVEFQGGLSAILGSSPTPSQVEILTLRARCFYFARKMAVSNPIDFEAYKSWYFSHSSSKSQSNITQSSSQPTQDSDNQSRPDNPPYPTSFAALVELITSGAPIPGIKEIPPTLLTSQATQTQVSKRRKPWEKDGHVIEKVEGAGEGTFGDRRDHSVLQEFPEDDAKTTEGSE